MILRYVSVFSILIALFSDPVFADVEKGKQFMLSKNYDAAFRELYLESQSKNPYALFIIGSIMIEGLGTAIPDEQNGKPLLDEAIKLGQKDAAIYMGRIYKEGKVVAKNIFRSKQYYEAARHLGVVGLEKIIASLLKELSGQKLSSAYCREIQNIKAHGTKVYFDYARCLESGVGIKKNIPLALDFFRKAGKSGNPTGFFRAAKVLLENVKDKFAAIDELNKVISSKAARKSLIKKAKQKLASIGFSLADCQMAFKERSGKKVNLACEPLNKNNNPTALEILGDIYAVGDIELYPKNLEVAIALYERVYELGAYQVILKIVKAYQDKDNTTEYLDRILVALDDDRLNDGLKVTLTKRISDDFEIAKKKYYEDRKTGTDILMKLVKAGICPAASFLSSEIFNSSPKSRAREACNLLQKCNNSPEYNLVCGNAKYEEGKYSGSYELLIKACNKEKYYACYVLGNMHNENRLPPKFDYDVNKRLDEAMRYWEEAANKNVIEALIKTALEYDKYGDHRNPERAKRNYEQALKLGSLDAKYHYAEFELGFFSSSEEELRFCGMLNDFIQKANPNHHLITKATRLKSNQC